MGSPPPPDAPSLEEQDTVATNAQFSPGPPAASLCGFVIPFLSIFFNINLPGIPFPIGLPTISILIGLNCSLSNPIDISGGVSYGGGRIASFDPDPDLNDD